jgi:hypothetical protein
VDIIIAIRVYCLVMDIVIQTRYIRAAYYKNLMLVDSLF